MSRSTATANWLFVPTTDHGGVTAAGGSIILINQDQNMIMIRRIGVLFFLLNEVLNMAIHLTCDKGSAPGESLIITSKFPGTCSSCGSDYAQGDQIRFFKTQKKSEASHQPAPRPSSQHQQQEQPSTKAVEAARYVADRADRTSMDTAALFRIHQDQHHKDIDTILKKQNDLIEQITNRLTALEQSITIDL